MGVARRVLVPAAYAAGLPLLLVVGWALATQGTTNLYLPSPARVLQAFTRTWLDPDTLTGDVLPSLGRFAVGVLLSIVIGIVAGTAIGATPWLRALLEPMLEFFRAIPPVVLVPVLMLLLGIDDSMKLAVIVSGSVWPVLLNTVEGVRGTDPVLVDTSRSYRVRGLLAYRYVVLPAASPQIMAGIRLCLSIGLILMVISEMFASSSGLGYQIVYFQRQYMVAEMWGGILLLGVVGVVVAAVFQLVERRVLHWYHGSREVARG
ncbi:binding-protein-dependent transport systems inner membrane component [Cellulomonas flavigena DSM 20109]|uniref:Binding-protein-dependent transport systems inner membrane component n=1 Tax=Cellulomonas flavigena (strain ATCC 482 / DSM 20109 / BCRC 11376 / JCM 18109 / NBRC 3775 / NCIMB 8073 / NRS 134) TaxID=446466 RepID=D5UH02_CELFN|nr:ABC transporter permease [Cellulomonas flavigena]ADG73205.1 binding-protein-dependent transport systems inner membrane component [Cellulomonas flavigena DSM 20109]